MKKLFSTALLLLALLSFALGQTTNTQRGSDNQPAQEAVDRARSALEELQEAARLYRNGDFAGAQKHSERALEIDGAQPTAPFFIARSIHAQYRVGIFTPLNISKAHEAIAAYQRVLDRWPNNEEAFNAIGFLYGAIKEDEKQLEWIKRRALDSTISEEKRSEAYTFLASKDWDCSFRITEDKENQYTLVGAKGRKTVRFKMPQNQEDFDKALLCTTKGLEKAEMAIKLNSENEKAWGYKAALLYEARKLAEMEGKMKKARKFWRKGEEARKRRSELTKKREAEPFQSPEAEP